MKTDTTSVSPETILGGLQLRVHYINERMNEIRRRLAELGSGQPLVETSTRPKPRFSPEALERIAAAQRKRWAETRKKKAAANQQEAAVEPAKKKRTISPEHRNKVRQAQLKRWARYRRQQAAKNKK